MVFYKDILIKNFFKIKNNCLIIDVRSPKEYKEDHILNSINIPLLNDRERKIIGILYKKKGSVIAKK